MRIYVNGVDITDAIGSPSAADLSPALDLTDYLAAGRLNLVSLGTATEGRLEAIITIDVWLPGPGRPGKERRTA